MALPASPSVVVLENDQSIYTPNVESSVVGIVGFADKGPLNVATLSTSQENLLKKFGQPKTAIPGQGLEGALEVLEATNQVYFVRVGTASSLSSAVANGPVGACPTLSVASYDPVLPSSFAYTVVNNAGVTKVTSQVITLTSSTGITTSAAIIAASLGTDLLGTQDIFSYTDPSGMTFIASKYAGSGATLTLSGASPWLFGSVDVSSIVSGGASEATASGSSASSMVVKFSSVYPGEGYNLSSLRDGSVQGMSVEVTNNSSRDKLSINSEGSAKETFSVELSPSSPASIEFLLVNHDTNNKSDYLYSEIFNEGVSFTSGVPDQFGESLLADATFVDAAGVAHPFATPRFVRMLEGTFSFAGGESGYSTTETSDSDDRAALIGTAAAKSGLYALDDDSLNVSLALIPGISHQDVQNALITLAESSKNFVAIVSPPYGYSEVQEAVNWMNGRQDRTAAINNSYAAVYWPWLQVFNPYSAADEWFDPTIFAARQFVFTDNVSEPWFAPAGTRRGRLTKPSDVEVVLNQGDKDVLYTNNINFIEKETQLGIIIGGQKTAQRNPTALDRVNVRRLMIYLRKVLLRLGKPFQHEPNDQFTWEQVEEALRPFLNDLLARRAIVQGDVKCDSTTNTGLRVDRSELWCSVTIKPTKAAESIVFEVNLTNQSATING